MHLTFDLLIDYIKRSSLFYKKDIDIIIYVYCNNVFLRNLRIPAYSVIWISREEIAKKLFEGYSHNLMFSYAFENSKTELLIQNREEDITNQLSNMTLK